MIKTMIGRDGKSFIPSVKADLTRNPDLEKVIVYVIPGIGYIAAHMGNKKVRVNMKIYSNIYYLEGDSPCNLCSVLAGIQFGNNNNHVFTDNNRVSEQLAAWGYGFQVVV